MNRTIFSMAWPVVCSYALISAVDLVDLLMSKPLGEGATAAVVFGSQLMHVPMSLTFAVGAACVALMARASAAGDARLARHGLVGTLGVSAAVSLAFALVVGIFPKPVLALLNASPSVIAEGTSYVRLVLVASVILSVAHMFECAHRSRRDTFTPLAVGGVAAGVKVALNLALIPVLGLEGAGISTIGAHSAALVIYWGIGVRDTRTLLNRPGVPALTTGPLVPHLADFRDGFSHVRRAFRVAAPAVGERAIMNLGLLAYFSILGSYGTHAVVAYGWGVKMLAYSWLPGIGVGVAATSLVGQALGGGTARRRSMRPFGPP